MNEEMDVGEVVSEDAGLRVEPTVGAQLRAAREMRGQPDAAPRLAALASDADPWLAQAGANFTKGSPTSAALSFEMQRRTRHASLAEVFRLEYQASVGCCLQHDFAEGVRALLVDKDKNPQWQPAALDAVTPELIEAHLAPRFEGQHPLADLT